MGGVPETPTRGEIADYQRTLESGGPFTKPFGSFWQADHWTKWATIREIIRRLAIPDGASILDVGCGEGWTSLFLAESGYEVLGTDFAPAAIQIAQIRAARWSTQGRVRFAVADMEDFNLEEKFDLVLIFEALHHARRRRQAVREIAQHVKDHGWVVFGEPSWLHSVSPHARSVQRESGWVERGVPVSRLKADCKAAGLGNFRRFFEGTLPYERRVREFSWQLIRLIAGNLWVAPQASVWLAAQRRAAHSPNGP
jgi:SAM-dependent methyltransferase